VYFAEVTRRYGGEARIWEVRPGETDPGWRDGGYGTEAGWPGEVGARGPNGESHAGSGTVQRHFHLLEYGRVWRDS
jgi:hypothetical protein